MRNILILTMIILINFKVFGQTLPNIVGAYSNGKNYMLTKSFRTQVKESQLPSIRNIGQENQKIQYFDGLGRLSQTVDVMLSPAFKDVVQHIEYDTYGREAIKYLPYVGSNQNGEFKPGGASNVTTFYSKTSGTDINGIVRTNKPFSVAIFENSPLDRIIQKGSPGQAWQPAASRSSTGRTVVTVYGANDSSKRKDFKMAGKQHQHGSDFRILW